MNSTRHPLVAALTLAAVSTLTTTAALHAQNRGEDVGDTVLPSNASAPLRIGRLPIHTAAPDQGIAYGTWTATDTYKASFHGAPTFVPYLGKSAPRNLPVSWHTRSVRVAGRELLQPDQEPVHHQAGDYRYEYRYGEVTEAYDVRVDGLEQTFVFATAPAQRGAITVDIDLDTPLIADEFQAAHRAVDLRDPDRGDVVVRYGAALAFDAIGQTIALDTTVSGNSIRLTVPAHFVGDAIYPLTIDPLTSNVRVHGGTEHYGADVARDDSANELHTTVSFAASNFDIDMFLISTPDCFRTTWVVEWADVTTSWSTSDSSVASCDSPAKVVLAFSRFFPSQHRYLVRYHVRQASDRALSTQYNSFSPTSGKHDWRPRVGGTSLNSRGDKAIIVYQQENTGGTFVNTLHSRACARIVDVSRGVGASASHGSEIVVRGSSRYDYDRPTVNRVAGANSGTWGWMMAFQYWYDLAASPQWRVGVMGVSSTGTRTLSDWTATASSSSAQQIAPQIAGDQRYLISFNEIATTAGHTSSGRGNRVYAQRFNFPIASGRSNSTQPPQLLRSNSDRRWEIGRPDMDSNTQSHWVVPVLSHHDSGGTGNIYLHRLGHTGRSLESVTLHNASATVPLREGQSMGVCFDDDARQFAAVFAANGAPGSTQPGLNNTSGACYTYDQPLAPASGGTGCSPTASLSWNGSQQVGSEFCYIRLHNVPSGRLATVGLSLNARTTAGVPGTAPGCLFLLDLSAANFLGFFPARTSNGGLLSWQLPLPGYLNDFTTLYFQGWHLDSGTQFLGTRRLDVQLRR